MPCITAQAGGQQLHRACSLLTPGFYRVQGEPLTFDLLLALALLDALAGDGGGLWDAYANELLPEPQQLILPMCWGEEHLRELQHAAISNAALKQQVGA